MQQIRVAETSWFEARRVYDGHGQYWVTLRLQESSRLWFGSDGWLDGCRFETMSDALAVAETLEPMIEEAWRLELALNDAKQRFINHVYKHTTISGGKTRWCEPAKT